MKRKKRVRKGLDHYLDRAGMKHKSHWVRKSIFGLCLIINVVISLYLLFYFSQIAGMPFVYILIIILAVWGLAFFLWLGLIWLCFYAVLDLHIFKRTKSMEEMLPDFLQLTATNVRAGMTIDKALWLAIRPRFGILATEIETVAKEVMSGEELADSLKKFSNKYDSDILKKSMNLLIEGINSGSEIGDLLTRIAQNIQEVRTIRKEMAANVTSYAIFITFAAVVAAPILLALAKQLIIIITQLVSGIGTLPRHSMLSVTSVGVSTKDFHIFAMVTASITAFCSALIVSIIKKGNVKEGLRYIPTFIISSLVIYLIATKLLGMLFTGIF